MKRRTFKNPVVVAFTIFMAFLMVTAPANEIIRGTTLQDGQQLYASDLHGLIDNATVGVGFYNDQQTTPLLNSGYYFLVEDPGNQVYRRITAQTMLYGNTNMWLFQTPSATIQSNATFLFYDPTNNVIRTITASNLFQYAAQWVPVQNLLWAQPTNGVQYLTPWSNSYSGLQTNNPPYLLTWTTNGVPHYITYSNFEVATAGDFGTNFYIPYQYTNTFCPWLNGGTNTFTNAWGFWTNFQITNLYFTNQYVTATNLKATLVDSDSFPVLASSQGTNTTATLLAMFQYFTNKFTQPPYTVARVSYDGFPFTCQISNATIASNWFFAASHGMAIGQVQPVSFVFAGTASTTLPTTPQISANKVYYAVAANANNFVLYTSYANAISAASPITLNSSPSTTANQNICVYLLEYAAFNCDAIQIGTGTGTNLRLGCYDICFRTNSVDALYYANFSTMPSVDPSAGTGPSGVLGFYSTDNIKTTSKFRIQTATPNNAAFDASRVEVTIFPQ